ncbi:DUF1853 family protein [Flavobacterium sp. WC2430]|uniref:DUF1853 family protein n=1 Tax=Flavobacterium sp. WC2430 TaxID=3234137 RepID=UPI003466B5E0
MKTKSRIASILKADCLDSTVTGMPTFYLSELILQNDQDFQLPTNVRLGHLAEKIVSELIKLSTNYKVLYENSQIIEDQKTIGEIDFIVENSIDKKLIHMELAYKFYLLDPSISSEFINNWIGPNRNDSLHQKLDKLKSKQFPLLYHSCAKSKFSTIDINTISQALCLLVSLFIPYEFNTKLPPVYQKAVKGYYFNLETFNSIDNPEKQYYLPSKREWGISPSENEIWNDYKSIENQMNTSLKEKQSVLCWQKYKEDHLSFFIVWW